MKVLMKNHRDFMIDNRLLLESQQRFKSERHHVLLKKLSKIALSSNDDKRIQSIDSIQSYAYGTKNV